MERKDWYFRINWSLATEIRTKLKSKEALWENIFTKGMWMYILFYGIINWQVNYDISHYFWLGQAQDIHFFYPLFHLSALRNCVLVFSTNFLLFFILKWRITQFSHSIVYCTKTISKMSCSFSDVTQFVGIELLLLKRALSILSK